MSPTTGKLIGIPTALSYVVDEVRKCFVVNIYLNPQNQYVYSLKFSVNKPFFKLETEGYVIPTNRLSFSNKKRFYAVNDRLGADGNRILDAAYDIAVTAFVNDSFPRLKDWTYTTRYQITNSSGFTFPNESTTEVYLVKRFLQREDCYDVTSFIYGKEIPGLLQGRFCTKLGINVSLEVVAGLQLGIPAQWHLSVPEFGNSSCITVASGDGQVYVAHLPSITPQQQNTNCLQWGVTLSNTVVYVPLVVGVNGMGGFTAVITHNYADVGDFKVELMAINYIHNQQNSFINSVLDIDCHSPVIELLGKNYPQ